MLNGRSVKKSYFKARSQRAGWVRPDTDFCNNSLGRTNEGPMRNTLIPFKDMIPTDLRTSHQAPLPKGFTCQHCHTEDEAPHICTLGE